MDKLEPCPFCGGEAKWVEDTGGLDTFGLVVDHDTECFLALDVNRNDFDVAWNTRAVTDEMVERAAVARCVELIREVEQGFLSPEYATYQPLSSFQERFACRMVAERIEQEYALGSTEQRALLGKPSHAEEHAALTAALGGGNG